MVQQKVLQLVVNQIVVEDNQVIIEHVVPTGPVRLQTEQHFDEDSMQHALVNALRARGIDILTALEAQRIEHSDENHLDFATAQGRVLYSFNVGDFYRLHMSYIEQNKSHAGIILALQQQYSVGGQMRRLLQLIAHLTASDMQNRVGFLSAWAP